MRWCKIPVCALAFLPVYLRSVRYMSFVTLAIAKAILQVHAYETCSTLQGNRDAENKHSTIFVIVHSQFVNNLEMVLWSLTGRVLMLAARKC